ncbi:MAG: LemA family protein [Flavobacteriales bacterium]
MTQACEACRQYMGYEKAALEAIIKARSAVATAQPGLIWPWVQRKQLRLGLGNLFALAESYPELKANESFRHLQTRITGLEHDIADRREFYNDSTNINNIRIEQFPDIPGCQLFGFSAFDLLEFSEFLTGGCSIESLVFNDSSTECANALTTSLFSDHRWSGGALVCFWFCFFHYFKRARLIEDTPTSRIRSAAQGYIEIVGAVSSARNKELAAPLSG